MRQSIPRCGYDNLVERLLTLPPDSAVLFAPPRPFSLQISHPTDVPCLPRLDFPPPRVAAGSPATRLYGDGQEERLLSSGNAYH